jgi:hypothetical protein
MPPRDDHLKRSAAGDFERDARRRYQVAIAAAMESLRRAENRFHESTASIDAHIHRALAAAGPLTASLVAGRD